MTRPILFFLHRSRSIINFSSRTRSKERGNSTCRRKRRVISLIAAVKERGNGTKMLHNQHPIKELRTFPLFFFFLSLGIRKNEMDRMGSCFEREEALEKSKRVGCVDDELHEGEWNTPEHLGLCFQIICIIVYCGGATQSWRDVITGGRAFTYIKSWLPWSSSIRVFSSSFFPIFRRNLSPEYLSPVVSSLASPGLEKRRILLLFLQTRNEENRGFMNSPSNRASNLNYSSPWWCWGHDEKRATVIYRERKPSLASLGTISSFSLSLVAAL